MPAACSPPVSTSPDVAWRDAGSWSAELPALVKAAGRKYQCGGNDDNDEMAPSSSITQSFSVACFSTVSSSSCAYSVHCKDKSRSNHGSVDGVVSPGVPAGVGGVSEICQSKECGA